MSLKNCTHIFRVDSIDPLKSSWGLAMIPRSICGALDAFWQSYLWVYILLFCVHIPTLYEIIGYPLFPGESEGDQLLAMMEILGEPSNDVMKVLYRTQSDHLIYL